MPYTTKEILKEACELELVKPIRDFNMCGLGFLKEKWYTEKEVEKILKNK